MKTNPFISIAVCIIFLYGCGEAENQSKTNETKDNEFSEKEVTVQEKEKTVKIDSSLTAFSNFLAANESLNEFVDSNLYNSYQKWE